MIRWSLVERCEEVLSRELPDEVVGERPWQRPGVDVAGPGKALEDLAVEGVAQHPVDLLDPHAALREGRIAVAGERVARLPVVVVGVEDPLDLVTGSAHRFPPGFDRVGTVAQ